MSYWSDIGFEEVVINAWEALLSTGQYSSSVKVAEMAIMYAKELEIELEKELERRAKAHTQA